MSKVNRSTAFLALGWGVALIALLPFGSRFSVPGGNNAAWPLLLGAEVILAILCTWSLRSARFDMWARVFTVIAIAIAVDAGVDLSQAYNTAQTYDSFAPKYALRVSVVEPATPFIGTNRA